MLLVACNLLHEIVNARKG